LYRSYQIPVFGLFKTIIAFVDESVRVLN
jgi:hypothetical protein